jgi:hypothetical protein
VTTTANPNPEREAIVSNFSVTCPCGSGHVVEASDAGFSAVTITVAACGSCREAGIVSREMRKSYGVSAYVSTPAVRHADGLVAFA